MALPLRPGFAGEEARRRVRLGFRPVDGAARIAVVFGMPTGLGRPEWNSL